MSLFNKKEKFKNIEPKEAFSIFEESENNSDNVILDVRTPEEYSEGHVANSKLINVQSANFEDEISKLDKNKTYFVYCKSGVRSNKASNIMSNLGFEKIYNIIGGFEGWKMNNLPFER